MRTLLLVLAAGLLTHCTRPSAPFDEYTGRAGGVGALPGLASHSDALRAKLIRAAAAHRSEAGAPHSSPSGAPPVLNRLILEPSPYLRQHAFNPVNWFAWGDAPFELARRLKRPVLLSVGYSTCHWCHVMARESFEDPEIARYLNTHYVAIKVDREERPDIDSLYMNAVTALSGRGGWPMMVWLNPDRQPFYATTYLPARDGDRGVEHGFLTVLKAVEEAYFEKGPEVARTARRLTSALESTLVPEPVTKGEVAQDASIVKAVEHYRARFDKKYGGLKGAPKFPSSIPLPLLMRYAVRSNDKEIRQHVDRTLSAMAEGALYDALDGGFHRYTMDAQWNQPHFEKMLYDNALLAQVYADGVQFSGKYRGVVEGVLDFVTEQMSHPDGGFYSAVDAGSPDAKGKEKGGHFYTWTQKELKAAVPRGSDPSAFFELHPMPTEDGGQKARYSLSLKSGVDIANPKYEPVRSALRKARRKKTAPFVDRKVITAWNSMMISAFARGSWVLGREDYLDRARRADKFLWAKLQKDGALFRLYLDEPQQKGFLDDYAFYLAALLDLFECTGERDYLNRALILDETMARGFAAPEGGYFVTSNDHERLLAREKPYFDGAIPSGNSVAAQSLLRLYQITTQERYLNRWASLMQALGMAAQQSPWGVGQLMLGVDFRKDRTKQVVLIRPPGAPAGSMEAVLRKNYFPNHVRWIVDGAQATGDEPLLRGKKAKEGKVTAYVCEEGVCKLPITQPNPFQKQMAQRRTLP